MPRLFDVISYLKYEFVKMAESVENAYEHDVISKVLRYIDKNSSSDLKLESLADLFGYNSAYLGKLFKSSTGEKFNLYLDKKRVSDAKALLMQADLKVYHLSEMVGYKNLDYFYKKFKRYVGESPNEYRRNAGIFLD
jgi:two-component system response regulator YesN